MGPTGSHFDKFSHTGYFAKNVTLDRHESLRENFGVSVDNAEFHVTTVIQVILVRKSQGKKHHPNPVSRYAFLPVDWILRDTPFQDGAKRLLAGSRQNDKTTIPTRYGESRRPTVREQ